MAIESIIYSKRPNLILSIWQNLRRYKKVINEGFEVVNESKINQGTRHAKSFCLLVLFIRKIVPAVCEIRAPYMDHKTL